jgi:(E)-4-hydroxy-3-methylbut-2-enyl-diphosphate synthase
MNELEVRLEDVKESIDVAVIGCYVNGPGESKAAHVGLTGASPKSLIYVDGLPDHKINNDDIVDHLEKTVRRKVKELEMENKKIITKA